jgi:hypothetical protein
MNIILNYLVNNSYIEICKYSKTCSSSQYKRIFPSLTKNIEAPLKILSGGVKVNKQKNYYIFGNLVSIGLIA